MSKATNHRPHWSLVALVVVLLGCGGSTAPTAGTLKVNLATPHNDDGALLVTISGGRIDSIEAEDHRVYTFHVDGNTLGFILAGEIDAGTIARIHIPDTRQASNYTAVVGQAAARVTYAQRDPATYTVSVVP